MISWLLIFRENFFFIVKRLFLHEHVLLAATSTAKRSGTTNGRKTAARASASAHMVPCANSWTITRPVVLVSWLKNRLKGLVLRWSGTILTGIERVAYIVCTNWSLKAFLSSSYSPWWHNLVLGFSRGFWRRGFKTFTVRRALSIVLWSMRTLSKLSHLNIFLL